MEFYRYTPHIIRIIEENYSHIYLCIDWEYKGYLKRRTTDVRVLMEYKVDFENALGAIGYSDWVNTQERLSYEEVRAMCRFLNG